MASVQANPEMPGQGQLPANITREQIQHVFQVSPRPAMLLARPLGAFAYPPITDARSSATPP